MRMCRRVFSIAIAHTQTEQTRSPTITDLTIQCACKNSVRSERSDELSPICGRSAAFMGYPFRLSGTDQACAMVVGTKRRRQGASSGAPPNTQKLHAIRAGHHPEGNE